MDTIQAILIAVVLVLTIMLTILGFQVFYILRELRKTIDKANRVLDNTESITESVEAPVSSFSAILMGLKSGTALASFISRLRKKRK